MLFPFKYKLAYQQFREFRTNQLKKSRIWISRQKALTVGFVEIFLSFIEITLLSFSKFKLFSYFW